MAFDPKPDGGSKGAEGILTQIKGLLNQYEALGPDTPLSEEAKSFEADVDRALDQVKGSAGPDNPAAGDEGDQPGSSKPTSFRDATKAARDSGVMSPESPSSQDGETKTQSDGSAAQSQEEDPTRKKRSKAGFPYG